jgi:diglucosylglycerate octanoyltransferase
VTGNASSAAPRRLLVFADSLAFHGPQHVEPPDAPGLYPNVCARELGPDVAVDLVARLGYTARDGWWALTKDPVVWGTYLPRADGVVLALGQYDQLPAAIPTWLRESIPYITPGSVRRRVRGAYLRAAPRVISASGGRLSTLSTTASNHYLTRMTDGIRYMRPGLPIVRVLPAPWDSHLYPSTRPHEPAVARAREWCRRMDIPAVDADPLICLATNNPDGLHWGWDSHERVGRATAGALAAAGLGPVPA